MGIISSAKSAVSGAVKSVVGTVSSAVSKVSGGSSSNPTPTKQYSAPIGPQKPSSQQQTSSKPVSLPGTTPKVDRTVYVPGSGGMSVQGGSNAPKGAITGQLGEALARSSNNSSASGVGSSSSSSISQVKPQDQSVRSVQPAPTIYETYFQNKNPVMGAINYGVDTSFRALGRLEYKYAPMGGNNLFYGRSSEGAKTIATAGLFINPITGPLLSFSAGAGQFFTPGGITEIKNAPDLTSKTLLVGGSALGLLGGGYATLKQGEALMGMPKFEATFLSKPTTIIQDANGVYNVKSSAIVQTKTTTLLGGDKYTASYIKTGTQYQLADDLFASKSVGIGNSQSYNKAWMTADRSIITPKGDITKFGYKAIEMGKLDQIPITTGTKELSITKIFEGYQSRGSINIYKGNKAEDPLKSIFGSIGINNDARTFSYSQIKPIDRSVLTLNMNILKQGQGTSIGITSKQPFKFSQIYDIQGGSSNSFGIPKTTGLTKLSNVGSQKIDSILTGIEQTRLKNLAIASAPKPQSTFIRGYPVGYSQKPSLITQKSSQQLVSTTIQTPIQKDIQSPKMAPLNINSQKIIPSFRSASIQTPKQTDIPALIQPQIQVPIQKGGRTVMPTPNPSIPVIPKEVIPFIPIFYPPKLFGLEENRSSRKIASTGIRRYTPSLSALVFNIKGKAPKGLETGARVRPITKGFSWTFGKGRSFRVRNKRFRPL